MKNKKLLAGGIIAVWIIAMIGIATAAALPAYAPFYQLYLQHGTSPFLAHIYAWTSAVQAARWINVPLAFGNVVVALLVARILRKPKQQ